MVCFQKYLSYRNILNSPLVVISVVVMPFIVKLPLVTLFLTRHTSPCPTSSLKLYSLNSKWIVTTGAKTKQKKKINKKENILKNQ